MHLLLILLRITHVTGAAAWMGALVSLTYFIIPGVLGAAPGSGPFVAYMSHHARARGYLRGTALATVLSGAALLWSAQSASRGMFLSTRPGMAYAIGGMAALVALVLSLRPWGLRAAGLPHVSPEPAVERSVAGTHDDASAVEAAVDHAAPHAPLARAHFVLRASLALMGVAALAMAVARYL